MPEFEILVRGTYRPQQLVVTYDSSQRINTTSEMQAWIDHIWQQRLIVAQKKQILLFDGPLFRLIKAELCADGSLSIQVSDTSYKEYVATRTPQFTQEYARNALSNPLAVCSVIETNDNHILIERRRGSDVYEGRYHVIGGFMERNRDVVNSRPDPFGAIRREIREETGIQAADMREQLCLGVVYDVLTPHPELCFVTQLSISRDEVFKREPEDDEVKQLLMLPVTATNLKQFIVSNFGTISATGEANLILYGRWKFGEEWNKEVV